MYHEDKKFRIFVREAQKGAEKILAEKHHSNQVIDVVSKLKEALIGLEKDVILQSSIPAQLRMEKHHFQIYRSRQSYLTKQNNNIRKEITANIAVFLKVIIDETTKIKKSIEADHQVNENIHFIKEAAQKIAENLRILSRVGEEDDEVQ